MRMLIEKIGVNLLYCFVTHWINSMSKSDAKKKLQRCLTDLNMNVVALTGPWGCGKTFLVSEELVNKTPPALYASLFGVSSLDNIKKDLILNYLSLPEKMVTVCTNLKSIAKGLTNYIPYGKTLQVMTDIQWLALAERLLSNKTIILDDIERRQHSLSIQELFGFIDKYTKKPHNCKFILILDKSKLEELADKEWNVYKEKVIEEEIYLSITPDEAFNTAKQTFESNFLPEELFNSLKSACVICGFRNIRILQKVIYTTKFLFSNVEDEYSSLLQYFSPSIALLSGVYYQAFEKTITLDSICKLSPSLFYESEVSKLDKENLEYWKDLLQNLGIYYFDAFEQLLINFFIKGNLDKNQIHTLLSSKKESLRLQIQREKIEKFYDDIYWNKDISYDQLRETAKELEKDSINLSPSGINNLLNVIEQIPKALNIKDKILDSWRSNYLSINHEEDPSLLFQLGSFREDIQEILQQSILHSERFTVPEVSRHIVNKRGWGEKHERYLNGLTEEDLKQFIKTSSPADFHVFMDMMWLIKGNQHFEKMTRTFKDACQSVIEESGSSDHLKDILKRVSSKL